MRKMEKIHLTQFAKHGGCAAKIHPDTLGKVLGRLPKFHEDNLLVGFETSDDAAVYKLSDDTAVIQTLDFFYACSRRSLYVRTDCGCECAKRRICDGRRTEDRVEYRLFSRETGSGLFRGNSARRRGKGS